MVHIRITATLSSSNVIILSSWSVTIEIADDVHSVYYTEYVRTWTNFLFHRSDRLLSLTMGNKKPMNFLYALRTHVRKWEKFLGWMFRQLQKIISSISRKVDNATIISHLERITLSQYLTFINRCI